ncbi:MAG: glycosyltransferase family 4 protein [Candidatus Bathyarchaeia archaeon]
MKLVMINDCAYVGETLLKYLPENIEKTHIKRGRGLWSKTFGIAYKIFKAKGDIYHVNYLLQDCYLASKLKKQPLIGHAHGTDLRHTLNHKLWGRIVKHNLKSCDKILVSTPDLIETAKKYNDNSEYFPNPIDTELFYTKPFKETRKDRVDVLIASACDWSLKGTDIAIRALSKINDRVNVFAIGYGKDLEKTVELAETLNLPLKILPKVSHGSLNRYYWDAEVVIDQFLFGVLGMISLEAIACGRPVITFISSEYTEYKDFPIKDIKTEDEIANLFDEDLEKLWKAEYQYLMRNHDPKKVADKIIKIYKSFGSLL